tara:strand:- start:616 stop:1248 length:633 start_codon:yes stop_codon:yes gene_type:complete
MSKISLKHSGGNVVSLNSPTSAPTSADVAFKLPNADGTSGQAIVTDASGNLSFASKGKILQTVQTVKTDVFTTTSQSFTDITGLSGTITPTSSSNKILISYTLSVSGNGYPMFKLLRGSTDIFVGDAASNRVQCLFGGYIGGGQMSSMTIPVSGSFLDSPSTTSATTYKFQTGVIHSTGYSTFINRSQIDTDFNYHARTASSIILMEVAA